ncbi:MAG: Holliday junction branch migration protein RuvA [Brooklawnia sp.]|jgi:Holliday junction DNA helicase RuvA
MISQLTGTAVGLGPNWAVVDVSGVGFKLNCPPATAAALRPGEPCTLHTSLVVREDALTLFGFGSDLERETFELVQLASGVGPKLAMALVSVLSPAEVVQAIQSESITTLTRVPGIGRKGAEKMIIELRDRVAVLGVTPADSSEPGLDPATERWREQVTAGLQSLGWSPRDAQVGAENVAGLVAEEPQISLGRLMKAALQSLARA